MPELISALTLDFCAQWGFKTPQTKQTNIITVYIWSITPLQTLLMTYPINN